jgi:hypothetical protein
MMVIYYLEELYSFERFWILWLFEEVILNTYFSALTLGFIFGGLYKC